MPAGTTPDERFEYQQMQKWTGYMNGAMESCPLKMVLSGGAGKRPLLFTDYKDLHRQELHAQQKH